MKPMWNNRNLRLLVLGQASSLVGNYTLKFALSMYILEVTGSAALFATFLSVAMVPTIVLSPFGGILADRGDRRRIMVTLDACAGLAVLLAALTLPLGHALGVIGAYWWCCPCWGPLSPPTVQACVPQMLEGEDLVRGSAVVAQVQAVALWRRPFWAACSMPLWGWSRCSGGRRAAFWSPPCWSAASNCPRLAPVEGLGVREVLKQDLAASGRFLWREEPGMLKLLLLAALVSFFLAGILVVGFPFLVRTVLASPPPTTAGRRVPWGWRRCWEPLGGPAGREAAAGPSGAGHWGRWPVPAPGGAGLPAAPWEPWGGMGCWWRGSACASLGAASSPPMPLPPSRGGPSGAYGEGDVLCVHPLLCAQPLGQLVYGALFDRFAYQVFWVPSPRLWWCVPWVWPPGASSGGGRERHRQRDKAKFVR